MWIVILVGVLLIFQVLRTHSKTSTEIAFSDLLDKVEANQVDRVLIKREEIFIRSTGVPDEGAKPRYDLRTRMPHPTCG